MPLVLSVIPFPRHTAFILNYFRLPWNPFKEQREAEAVVHIMVEVVEREWLRELPKE